MPNTDKASITVGDVTVTTEVAHPVFRGLPSSGLSAVTNFPFMRKVTENAQLQQLLQGGRNRLLSFQPLESEQKEDTPATQKFRAVFYDYQRNHSVVAQSSVEHPEEVETAVRLEQPIPPWEEFQEAVEHLKKDPTLGAAIQAGRLQTYRAMPAVVSAATSGETSARVLTVGLKPTSPGEKHQIVGVNMTTGKMVVFHNDAPAGSQAGSNTCGPPFVQQQTVSNMPGEVRITVTKGGTTLWTLNAIRPAASSGRRGSGVEVRYVAYKGKRVLFRGHVPILNVRYKNDACGPYRDWQNEEGTLVAPAGTDIGQTGFRLCQGKAKTMLETGSDQGNHLGTAIYMDGAEVVLVAEMEAGWYRYVCEWRFHTNGTIKPRFGFSAVANSCVCNQHFHHAYWRLDFDIETAAHNAVEEFNKPIFGPAGGNWSTLPFETRRSRHQIFQRKWRVRNLNSNAAYEIIPGSTDGVADAEFGVGDLWAVRYRSKELDDGVNDTTGTPAQLMAQLDKFVTGESIADADVVVWYAGHFTHDFHDNAVGHIIGPTLKPSNWT